MGHLPALAMFLIGCSLARNVHEIDGMITVTQKVDVKRIRRHVKYWHSDVSLHASLGEKMVGLLLAHQSTEVNMMARTLMEHVSMELEDTEVPPFTMDSVRTDNDMAMKNELNVIFVIFPLFFIFILFL